MRSLTAGADRTGGHEQLGVCRHGGPPEALLQESQSPVEIRVAGNPGCVSPLEDRRSGR